MIVWLAALAGAQSIEFEAGDRYHATDAVLAALGAWDEADGPYEDLEWGASVNARIATDLQCGSLNVDVDVNAAMSAVSELPRQLADLGPDLVGALPMLATCHLSPSLCAELKNLNLRIDQEIDFQAAMCRSIEGYIDKQADEGEQLRRDAAELATQQCIAEGGGTADAVRQCTENESSGLVVDIAQGFLDEKIATAPQRLISAAVDATNHELAKQHGMKEMLSAIAGEAEITVNGEVIPLLEEGTLVSEDIANELLYHGERYACSKSRLDTLLGGMVQMGETPPSASTAYAVEALEDTLKQRVTEADQTNLDTLDWATYRSFCLALRNTAAKHTAITIRDSVAALVDKAIENPQLPGLGKSKLKHSLRTMEAVVTALSEDDQLLSFGEWSERLVSAAGAERGHANALSETLREGEHSRRVLWEQRPPCNTYRECLEGGP